MRIWTVHPRYLDRQGLVALWREALLAQAVLLGKTNGYRHHPQLDRFQGHPSPVAAIATYLSEIHRESVRRGYHFNRTKIAGSRTSKQLLETHGQLLYEWKHLKAKLKSRAPEQFRKIARIAEPVSHSLFRIIPGLVRNWEKMKIG